MRHVGHRENFAARRQLCRENVNGGHLLRRRVPAEDHRHRRRQRPSQDGEGRQGRDQGERCFGRGRFCWRLGRCDVFPPLRF